MWGVVREGVGRGWGGAWIVRVGRLEGGGCGGLGFGRRGDLDGAPLRRPVGMVGLLRAGVPVPLCHRAPERSLGWRMIDLRTDEWVLDNGGLLVPSEIELGR